MRFVIFVILSCFSLTTFSKDSYQKHAASNVPHYQVIVIGAGISGLAAAQTLTKKHIPVMILEARNRVGGRIYTVDAWGFGLDLGAAWIHGIKNNPIKAICEHLQIKTFPTVYSDKDGAGKFKSFKLYSSNAKTILPARQVAKIARLLQEFYQYVDVYSNHLYNLSIEDAFNRFIAEHKISRTDTYLLHYFMHNTYTYEFAADPNDLSVQSSQPYQASPISGRNELFENGFNQILPMLQKDIPIRLNQTVKVIKYNKHGVDIFTQDNHYHSDYAVITLPLGVLKAGSVKFVPALPQSKINAINKLDMAVYNKIYLLFKYPFWDIKSEWIGRVPSHYNEKQIDIMNDYLFSHKPILVIFTGGSLAKKVEQWSDTLTIKYVMNELKKIYGNTIPEPHAYMITRWNNDPFSRGSYSYLPKGAKVENYRLLAQPVMNRLYFAGEATDQADPATVHGAYTSGISAGKEVFKNIRNK